MSDATTTVPESSESEVLAAAGPPGEVDPRRAWAQALVERARSEGVALTGEDGLLTGMVREVLQAGLDVEMAEHLGYEPYEPAGRNSGNSRNGSYPKTVATDVGPVELRMPRDRQGTFEPATIPKHVRRLEGLGANVLSLYAKGLTTGEIQAHLAEIYSTEVSRETISKITDAVLGEMAAWQSRPLDRVYPVLLIDAIVVKVRGSQVANRPVYVAIGVNLEGERDVLGLWLGPTGGEGRQAVDDHAHRAQEPWCRGRAGRLLRRAERTPRRDQGDMARGDRANMCRAPCPQQP
jgi:putative transposase